MNVTIYSIYVQYIIFSEKEHYMIRGEFLL